MASLKEVKNRIISVKSTRQITSAMKMVASAKLHKVQDQIENMLPYQHKLMQILTNFLRTDATFQSVFTEQRRVERVAIVALASNSSLCGAYNANVAKRLSSVVEGYLKGIDREDIHLFPIGKKMEEAVRKMGFEPEVSLQTLADRPTYSGAFDFAQRLMKGFAQGEFDQVVLLYHHFHSMGKQVLTEETYLPIDLSLLTDSTDVAAGVGTTASDGSSQTHDYIVEPGVSELMTELIPKVLSQKIYTVLMDANASEHAARTLAMQTATDNANGLIQDLTKQYNKSRQQAITNELLDIIGGSMK